MIDKGVKEVKLKIEPDGLKYDGLVEFAEEEDYEFHILRQLLESLAEKRFLKTKEQIRAIFCPKCHSSHILSEYSCPKCNSVNISRVKLIEHQFCGYTGALENFVSGTSKVCPNCKTYLGSLNENPPRNGSKKDYQIIGSTFECEKCGNRFNKPNFTHTCQKCGSKFDYKISFYEKINNYEILPDVIKKLRKKDEIIVLIIEDNPDEAKIITRTLQKSGEKFKIEHVLSGKQGLDKIESVFSDVILLDYMLPDMNGLEILEKIKNEKNETPVIMFTGTDDRSTAVKAMKLGASDYLIKSLEVYERLPKIIIDIVKKKE